jgi:ribonuclease HII
MICGLEHEKLLRARGFSLIAGIDEAGRGPMAGPVVAAAAILPEKFRHKVLRDSKALTHLQRERLYEELTTSQHIAWAVAVVDHEEIDRINILRASHEAMRRAVGALNSPPDHVLIDGLPVREFPIPQTALVKGDAISLSIAAASVIAKVTRDRLMLDFDVTFPQYGFAQHKGYCTEMHLTRLREHGPCPIHRRTFEPVQQTQFRFD